MRPDIRLPSLRATLLFHRVENRTRHQKVENMTAFGKLGSKTREGYTTQLYISEEL